MASLPHAYLKEVTVPYQPTSRAFPLYSSCTTLLQFTHWSKLDLSFSIRESSKYLNGILEQSQTKQTNLNIRQTYQQADEWKKFQQSQSKLAVES